MMHKAWHSIEEVPYCFFRSSIKFPGNMGPKINDLNPILSKNTRPVAAIKSLRFALFIIPYTPPPPTPTPPPPMKLKGGTLASPCLSVHLSVCGQNRVRCVSSTILAASISYLQILSTNLCVVCWVLWQILKPEFLAISLKFHLSLCPVSM